MHVYYSHNALRRKTYNGGEELLRMGEHMRTGTFCLDETADDEALEKAWNAWIAELMAQGLRPADQPIRWTETTATYRLFSVEHEQLEHTLDFDMTKLGKVGA